MIGAGLRLAGKLPSLLMKPGIGGALTRGIAESALVTGAFAGAPAAYDFATGKSKTALQDDLIERGKDVDTGYDTNMLDRVLYGDAVSDEAIDTRKAKKQLTSLEENNSVLLSKLTQAGVIKDVTGKRSASQLMADYEPQLSALAETKERDKAQRAKDFERQQPEYLREIRLQDEDRATRRQAATDARSDALLARQQSLDLGMAQLNSASAKSNREFDYQNRVLDYNMKARKAERMQKIAMALGGLGSLFAA